MAIHSALLGATKISGEEAKAFSRMVTHARGTKAAAESASNGRKLATKFAKTGSVSFSLSSKPAPSDK